MDSSVKNEKAQFDTSPQDSRICDEKSGLSSDWQGSYLSGNDRRQSRRIHDLSRKAESLHADKDNAPNVTNSQAAGFADDFGGFQGASAGIYLSGNEQARAAESTKSAAKTTLKLVIFIFAIILIISIAKNVDLWLKYNRLQDVYIDTLARHTGWERSYILEAMKYSLDKVKPNIKEQRESGQIDLFPYKERSLNKEFENLNKEIEKDIEAKIDKIELGGGSK